MKGLLFPLAIFSLTCFKTNYSLDNNLRNNSIFETAINSSNKLEIVGVKDNSCCEYRIYSKAISQIEINSIGENAFFSCSSMSSIMISNDIDFISETAFSGCSNLTSIFYTGSLNEFINKFGELDYSIFEYSLDEGFINYWNEFIRTSSDSNLCDTTKENYDYLLAKYSALNDDDKSYVNSYVDLAGTNIKSSMDFLAHFFNETPSPNVENKEMNKSTALSLILVASIIGMTSICVFFFFKSKNIID